MRRTLAVSLLLWGMLAIVPLAAQEEAPRADAIAVFLDCQTFGCDFDFFRTEIEWVNWVRDREVADVHLLVTAQSTGGGGRFFELSFLGRGPFQGEERELTYASSATATADEVRRGLAQVISRGMLPYVEGTPVADRLRVTYQAPPRAAAGAPQPAADGQVDDPWDYWVFSTGASGSVRGQSTLSTRFLRGSVTARRTTEAWKLSLSGSYSHRKEDYELDDRTVESVVEDWGASGLVAYSLATHWSLGTRARAGSTTYGNQDLYLSLAPGLEYSIFPYSQSTRRQVTLLWSLGATHWNYTEQTIFGHLDETRFDQSLTAQVDFTQPWGQASISGNASHYLHDPDLWRASVGGGVQVRLFKGFSLNVLGSYAWIRNQLNIPAGKATDDEILTRQRQLATNYSYYTSFGISYTFGSIFNNVVNPRFGGSSSSGMMIMF